MENTSEKVKLLIGVLVLQCCLAGFHVVTRAALNMGISKIVFTVYRNSIALALLTPFAYFLEKKKTTPDLFFTGTVLPSCLRGGFYLLGLHYLSPTYASAIQNTVPAITFILAASLRLEQVNINKKYGMAKVIGTVVSIGGAMIITLYKGMPVMNLFKSSHVLGDNIVSPNLVWNWTVGCLFLLGNCFAWSGWMALQGLVASGVSLSLQIWCIDRGGALFTAIFQPVQTVMVAIMAAIILGDELYTGGIIGAVLIVIGLYFVLWGKSQEKKRSSSGAGEPDLSRRLLGEDALREAKSVTTDVP
ncbi:hypothetical protein PR202_ga00608 [Eleusine coracana subsp. coracana]|uniref:WAT1-related protein n=1 Tax=Eleusine coracana subsp. coracana TaxID=191504 RepID=A0AAV5BGY1_ELECO|nr:hypothetical protein PR202_ga00608 [Eleusine coracana subsp. coracana]